MEIRVPWWRVLLCLTLSLQTTLASAFEPTTCRLAQKIHDVIKELNRPSVSELYELREKLDLAFKDYKAGWGLKQKRQAYLELLHDYLAKEDVFVSSLKFASKEETAFFNALGKTLVGSEDPLPPAALRFMAKHPRAKAYYKFALRMSELPAGTKWLIDTLFRPQALTSFKRGSTGEELDPTGLNFFQKLHYSLGNQEKWADGLKQLTSGAATAGKALLPFPLPRKKFYRSPLKKIAERQWEDPHYTPEPGSPEHNYLKTRGLLQAFNDRQKFLLAHPHYVNFRKVLSHTYNAALLVAYAAAYNHLLQLAMGGAAVPVDEYLEKDEFKLEDDEVQIIEDLVPFPHTALRIGNKVYNYGVDSMTIFHAKVYFHMKKIERMQHQQLQGAEQENPYSSTKKLNQAMKWASSIPESRQIATIKLKKEDVLSLKRHLENQNCKLYDNRNLLNSENPFFFITPPENDCGVMSSRALRDYGKFYIPEAIDGSPSQIMTYLSGLKANNDPRVKRVFQVVTEEPERKTYHLLRNTYINLLESKLFVTLFPWYAVERTTYDLTHTPEEMQWHTENQKAVMSALSRTSAAENLKNENSYFLLGFRLEALKKRKGSGNDVGSDSEILKKDFTRFFDKKLQDSQETLDDPDSTFFDLLGAQYNVEFIHKKRDDIFSELEQLK